MRKANGNSNQFIFILIIKPKKHKEYVKLMFINFTAVMLTFGIFDIFNVGLFGSSLIFHF